MTWECDVSNAPLFTDHVMLSALQKKERKKKETEKGRKKRKHFKKCAYRLMMWIHNHWADEILTKPNGQIHMRVRLILGPEFEMEKSEWNVSFE